LFFGQREVFLGDGFIVGKRREFWGEEFAVFVYSSLAIHIGHRVHVLNDPGDQFLVLFLGVLLIEDAVLLGTEANTGEEITGSVASVTI